MMWTRSRTKQVKRQVLEMLASGTQPKVICMDLAISKAHVSNIGRTNGYRFRKSKANT